MAKFKRVSADEAKSKIEQRGLELRSTAAGATIDKAMKAPPSWNKDERSARFTMTSEAVDRYGDVVITDGIDTTAFEKNPVGLLFHCSRAWPIGKWNNIQKVLKGRPPRMEGDLMILPKGGPVQEVDQAAWMIENGGISACSIGFVPDWDNIEMILDDEERWTGGLRFMKSELVECSICPVPANPQALVKSAGGDMALAKELIEDVLDNYAKTPAGVLISRTDYEKAYRTVVAKIGSPKPTAAMPSEAEIEAFAKSIEKDDLLEVNVDDSGAAVVKRDGAEVSRLDAPGLTKDQFEELFTKIASVCRDGDGDDGDIPDGDDPDDDDEVTAGKDKKEAFWACKASRDLPIDEEASWDGAGAKKRMLDAAGIGGDNPDHAAAAEGFLAVDTANPDLKGSYKLPFADMKDGKVTALKSGIDAAASRLSNTNIPDDVQSDARDVLDAYEKKMGSDKALHPVRDTDGMSIEKINQLAKAGVVFITELDVDGKKLGGDVIAASWDAAEKAVAERNTDEKVIGQLAEVIPAKDGEAFERSIENAPVRLKMVDKDGNEIKAARSSIDIGINLDTSAIQEAHDRVSSLSNLVDNVSAKLSKLFGKGGIDLSERIDPPLEEEKPVDPPSAEKIAETTDKARAVIARLKEKGLVEA